MGRNTLLQNASGIPSERGDVVYNNTKQNATFSLVKKKKQTKSPFLPTGESAITGRPKGQLHAFLEMEEPLSGRVWEPRGS